MQTLQVEALNEVEVEALDRVEVVASEEVEVGVLPHPCLQSSIFEDRQ